MYRKIEENIKEILLDKDNKILCIFGARQIGKTYIIDKISKQLFKNYIQINFDEDNKNDRLFKSVKSVDDFYIQLSAKYGGKIDKLDNTIIFLDEIQVYPQYFSLLKQFHLDRRYRFICSGSELGINLNNNEGLTPMGSVITEKMYPMDFEEFIIANGCGKETIEYMKKCFINKETINESIHDYILKLFKNYLFVGGLPECVKIYVEEKNVTKIKGIQELTYKFYLNDASKYDVNNKLKIKKIYSMILSYMQNKVKRFQISKINSKKEKFSKYIDEFDYLINSGVALDNKAIADPRFPLVQSSEKNLIKLYFNDVGILSYLLYKNNINAIINNDSNINLGSIYETVVAQELTAHNHNLFYYDRRKLGEVDFLIDDYENLTIVPIEIKSGNNTVSKSLPKIANNVEYHIKTAYLLSNNIKTYTENNIIHMPIYNIMFL